MGKLWIYFSFKINQDYIVKVLCINRNKPEMHCDGNCILMQRLKADEDQERKQIPQALKEQKELVFCYETTLVAFKKIAQLPTKRRTAVFFQQPVTSDFVVDIFHPPAFV
jgi:hypothetical protein